MRHAPMQNISKQSGIPLDTLNEIATACRPLCRRAALFGSRARGDHRALSDIDLAIWGIVSGDAKQRICDAMDALQTLLKYDLVFIDSMTPSNLLKNIQKDGVSLMDHPAEKANQYLRALTRLTEARDAYLLRPDDDLLRDALIKRFEFTYELAWKSAREYLQDQGIVNINSPKSVFREAYTNGLITQAQQAVWLDMIESRNLVTHMYDEEISISVCREITGRYLDAFESYALLLNSQQTT